MNHNSKNLKCLVAVVCSVGLAIVSFTIIPSRFAAALVAGGGFSLSQILVIQTYWRATQRREQFLMIFGSTNLGIFSIPQMALRLANPNRPTLMDMVFMGVPFSWFHLLSQVFMFSELLLLVAVTALGFWRQRAK